MRLNESTPSARVADENGLLRFQREIIACPGSYPELLQAILHGVERLVGAEGATLELVDGEELGYEATSGMAAPFRGFRIKMANSLSGRCISSNELMVCTDTEADPRVDLAACRKIGIRSMIIVPLPHDEQTFGALKVMSSRPEAFGLVEAEELQLTSAFIGATIGRKRAELALRESMEQFRTLADNIAQLAWMTDGNGYITWYNQRWFDYTGTTLAEMQGWGWTKVHHPDYTQAVLCKWQNALDEQLTWEDTFPLRRFDGEYRWFLSRAVPIKDAQGNVLRWLGTNTDITAQREAEDNLRRAKELAESASRAKDAFIATLSHELRTPLSPVLLIAGELQEDPRVHPELREQVKAVYRNVSLEARLIDDLLDMARIVEGKLAMLLGLCDAHELLRYALEIIEADRDAKGITITADLAAEQVRVQADSTRIQQVFWNVLKNALKFTEPGGTIQVRTANCDGRLVVEVRDTGRGIDPAMCDRIFEPFEQAGLQNNHRYGGLGIGLAICRAVMRMHGGDIEATSAGTGKGALFRITLGTVPDDLGKTAQPSSAGTIPDPSPRAGENRGRVLVVEDHEPTLQVLQRLLKRRGYTVTCASSCSSALEAVRQGEFDILVSDIGLPDGSGAEILPLILELQPRIRAIALTGYGTEEDRERTRSAGFAVHLTKPVDFGELQRVLTVPA